MKTYSSRILKFICSALFILLLPCCEPKDPIAKGTSIIEDISGTKTKSVEFKSESESHLYLTGTVQVDSGKVQITVTTPSNNVIYDRTIIKSKPQPIASEFGTLYGTWTLKYQSTGAKGNINISLGN